MFVLGLLSVVIFEAGVVPEVGTVLMAVYQGNFVSIKWLALNAEKDVCKFYDLH